MSIVAIPNQHSVYLRDLHYENRLWRNELAFCKDELNILEERLQEIIIRHTEYEVEAGVESYHNRFELQRKNISDLKHRIRKHEQQLADFPENYPIDAGHTALLDHTALRDDVDRFRDLYHELKKEFNRFAVRWM